MYRQEPYTTRTSMETGIYRMVEILGDIRG